jgi:hypothetical protein
MLRQLVGEARQRNAICAWAQPKEIAIAGSSLREHARCNFRDSVVTISQIARSSNGATIVALKRFNPLSPAPRSTGSLALPIDTHIPIPKPREPPLRVFPWHELEVGQSFLIEWPNPREQMDPYDVRVLQQRVACLVHAQNHACSNRQCAVPKKWTQRTIDDGIRVWRIE